MFCVWGIRINAFIKKNDINGSGCKISCWEGQKAHDNFEEIYLNKMRGTVNERVRLIFSELY